MNRESSKLNSPARGIMLGVTTLGSAGCALFGALYARRDAGWLLSCAVTCGLFAYHMLIRFLAPVIITAISGKSYDVQSRWFRPKPWEAPLYDFLRVKKWKSRVPSYDPGEFSMKLHTLSEIANNMCHAEAVHELIALLSFSSLLFAVPFGDFAVFLITALLAAAIDCVFVVVQRYNRPRVVKLMERRAAK